MRRSRAKGKNQAHAKGVSHMPDTWLEECVTKKKKKERNIILMRGLINYFSILATIDDCAL